MEWLEMNIYSETLCRNVSLNVLLPQTKRQEGYRYPVLWLLHSAACDHTAWLRRTSIERYAEQYEMAVVMPAAKLSMYTNMVHGGRYFDYIARELPALLVKWLPLSAEREKNFIAGASMGGYGAMKIGLTKPECYRAVGCFSTGNLYEDKYQVMSDGPGRDTNRRNEAVFGMADTSSLKGSEHDLGYLLEMALAREDKIPAIFQTCGRQDTMLLASRELKGLIGKNFGIQYYYEEADGKHDWAYWDLKIAQFLEWISKLC